MLSAYIAAAMRHGRYKLLDDGTYFGEIPGFQGVWADAATLEGCRAELQEVLEGWILLRLADQLPLPTVDNMALTVQDMARQ
ncbi:MAG: type II toxin-antitoxin system HicB family antitoxin [Chloroflexi bacterium]|nr:type II toxin-antitoxin system HicB family antitoxin [Chloroflexota bacterium]